jgi:hypothetical protein
MASLDCHIRTPDPTAHARLAWRADCPLCAHRLAGPPPATDIVSQRTRAAAAAALIVAATLGPTATAVAQDGMGDAAAPPGGKNNEQAPQGPDRTQPPADAAPAPVERDGPSVLPPPDDDIEAPDVEVPDVEVDPPPAPRAPQREEREVLPPAATPDREPAEQSPSRPERPNPPVARDEPEAPPRDRDDRDRPERPRTESPGDQDTGADPSPLPATPAPPAAERPEPADDAPAPDTQTDRDSDVDAAPRGDSRGESRGERAPDDDRRRGPAARDPGSPLGGEETRALPFGASGDQEPAGDSPDRSGGEQESGDEPAAASTGDRDGDDDSSSAASGDQATYTVAAGDSLWAIAAQQLGDDATNAQIAQLVTDLWDLNHHRIQSGDPDLIHPDLELRLP